MSRLQVQQIMALQDVADLARLSFESFEGRRMEQREFEHISALCGSAWKYPGAPSKDHAHAILTSGKHSNGFLDTLAMLTYPNICDIMAGELVKCLLAENPIWKPNWMVGSDHASGVFSSYVARRAWGLMGFPRYDFAEKGKDEVGGDIQRWERFAIDPDHWVMNIEELVSTSTTFMRVRAAIQRFHAYPIRFVPVVGVLVNRTGLNSIEGNELVSPFTFNFNIYAADACPFCAAGSPAIREPKKNWAKLIK